MKIILKKSLFVIILLLAIFAFVGCTNEDVQNILDNVEVSDEDIVIEVLNKSLIQYAEGDSEGSVTSDLTLTTVDAKGCTIEWASNNENVISKDGKVTRGETESTVKLTVTVTFNETKLSKSFNLIVKAKGNGGDTPIVPTGEISIGDALALTVAAETTTTETYSTRGKITEVQNATYGDLVISDGTNSILVWGLYDTNGNRYDAMSYQPVVGDTIVINGAIKNHEGTNELLNATMTEVIKDQGEDNPGTDDPQIIDSSITEVLGLTVLTNETTYDYYKITGTITSVTETTFGNFYVTDGTYSLLIYGLYDAEGTQYGSLESKPDEGDTIVLYGAVKNFKGTIEIVNAVLVSFEDGQPLEIESKTITEVNQLAAGVITKTSGTIIATYSRGYLLKDDTGVILVYMNTTSFTYVVGDVISVEGSVISYHNHNQFDATAKTEKTGTDEVQAPTPTVLDAAGVDAQIQNVEIGKYVEFSGTLVIDGSYYNMTVKDSETIISLTYPLASFGLDGMNDCEVKIRGYVLDLSTDGTRLNIMVTYTEKLGNAKELELPITGNFITDVAASTTLPKGWRWGQMCSKGSYASFWQSFRSSGDSVISSNFEATDNVTVSFTYYMNNYQTDKTSTIKVTAYDADGKEVTSAESANINTNKKDIGVANTHVLTFDLVGAKICSIKVEFVKDGGGNIAFSTIKVEKTAPQA